MCKSAIKTGLGLFLLFLAKGSGIFGTPSSSRTGRTGAGVALSGASAAVLGLGAQPPGPVALPSRSTGFSQSFLAVLIIFIFSRQ